MQKFNRHVSLPPPTLGECGDIRQQIESGFDDITEIEPEIRGIVERNWPHLLAKLPPDQ